MFPDPKMLSLMLFLIANLQELYPCNLDFESSLLNPLICCWGQSKMISLGIKSRQPVCKPWTHEHLEHECAIALGQSIATSTWNNYLSALNSYLEFVKIHNFPINPTADTLSFFTIFMCPHIKPDSVNTYLSGICQQLEPFFPDVHQNCKFVLVKQTLEGCLQIHAIPTSRKHALTIKDLCTVIKYYSNSTIHNDQLFVSQLLVGFFVLMCLSKLVNPNVKKLQNPLKVIKCTTILISEHYFQFFLPGHKGRYM